MSSDLLLAATFLTLHSELQPAVYGNLCKCCKLPFLHLKNQAFFTAYSDVFHLFGNRNFAGTAECLFMYNYLSCVYKLKESYKHPPHVRKWPSDLVCGWVFAV